jgi:hypothetical protein
MVKTIPAVIRFMEASLLRIARVRPRKPPRLDLFLFDAGRDDSDKDTAPHRPVAL